MKVFEVTTVATVTYNNWVEVDEQKIANLRAVCPNLTDEEIVGAMFEAGDIVPDDCEAVNWQDERVVQVRHIKEQG